jgi:hypothetical protein
MRIGTFIVAAVLWAAGAWAGGLGIPSRAPDLDVLPGFKQPPPGYGEVPFWWWSGDRLDPERLIGQLEELHRKGVSGVQVNYCHYDTPGWLTDHDEPAIFSDAWWQVYGQVSAACARLDMGIGMSTYTIDWPRGATNLFYRLFYSKPELNALELNAGSRVRVHGGQTGVVEVVGDMIAVRAYGRTNDAVLRGGIDLTPLVKDGKATWVAPPGDWEIWVYRAVRKPGSMNPLQAGMGETVIRGFFQQFQDHKPDRSPLGLNYFFNDELDIGVGKFAWNPDFAAEFARRKRYDLFEVLPAMWEDIGPITPKVRLDYADVRMALMEERYFKPIFEWHSSRGLIFACDSGGRGTDPAEFGDYFRATRWYTAPGHDTPGGRADLIKGKVSSSVADLYQRPRVWLEGYHSLGWGAAPEVLMQATRENYLYGCTLLNLHGLYYSTHGSHWEWAPPCYHFRMPYWAHMGVFLGYFERLSYLLSQGHLVADVAIVYPVAPYEAEMDGEKSRNVAFELGRQLMAAGINFEFVDNDSLARAVVEGDRLDVKDAGASFRALVLPNMKAVRFATLEKAAAFAKAGGFVYCVGALPAASDRAGRDDPEITRLNDVAFKPGDRLPGPAEAVTIIRSAFVPDVRGVGQTVRALHRRIGPRDIYYVMDARRDAVVEFRAKGAVELLDPWTGAANPARVVGDSATGTLVEMPLESYEAQVVAFTAGKAHVQPPPKETALEQTNNLTATWTVAFVPTMDNSHGDFRLPVTADNRTIGVEARRFAWTTETAALTNTAQLPATEDSAWERRLHGFGTQFYVLGPIPAGADLAPVEAGLAQQKALDPSQPVTVAGQLLKWRPYDFSWRYGREGDPGHQGYHGLKRIVTDDFLCLGKPVGGLNETRYEPDGGRYLLWTSATVDEPTPATILTRRGPPPDKSHTSPPLVPAVVYVNGAPVTDLTQPVNLRTGPNPLLVRFDQGGRGHFVLRRQGIPTPKTQVPLAMIWYGDPGVIPFDIRAGNRATEWFRFLSAPGTAAIRVEARGTIQAWFDGEPMQADGPGRFVARHSRPAPAVVALRVEPQTGWAGGAAIPEPVRIETDGTGVLALGDWSRLGILNNYSGGVRYRTSVRFSDAEARARAVLDLGRVAGTAEVHVNGRNAGIRVAPPWKVDVTGALQSGENTLEVMVYNTLANHYQTIPSHYRGEPTSGLLGPVQLLWRGNTNGPAPSSATVPAKSDEPIRAFCVDFNWGAGGSNGFPAPGTFAQADPEAHYRWYRELGANVIQTFCVSCNGYAWYQGSTVAPVQPGLKYDFLTRITQLAHADGVKVMGYFCVGANTFWSQQHPDESYGAPSAIHIPLTTNYVDYLCRSIQDALTRTKVDGFLIDWAFSPPLLMDEKTVRWLPCERTMYAELFQRPFPGTDKVDAAESLEFQRRALERCWSRIRAAAKSVRPDCVLWLSCFDLAHPQVVGTALLREADWVMNETPTPDKLDATREKVGPRARLIQCVSGGSTEYDASKVLDNPKYRDVGLYGFAPWPDPATTLPPAVPADDTQRNIRSNIEKLRHVYRAGLGSAK